MIKVKVEKTKKLDVYFVKNYYFRGIKIPKRLLARGKKQ